MKTYQLTYHWALPANMLDALGGAGVDEWLQVWPGMVLFKGNRSQEYYATRIKELTKVSMFIVAEYDPRHSYGWMPPSVWEWVKPSAPSFLTKTPDELAASLPGGKP